MFVYLYLSSGVHKACLFYAEYTVPNYLGGRQVRCSRRGFMWVADEVVPPLQFLIDSDPLFGV